ncbi:MAG: hypothetical protein ACREH7_03290 [Candidatus Rokuibacteriota bacterium]
MRYAIIALVVLILVGCASVPPRPVQSGFEDIPVPKGLEFKVEDSTIIESPSVKAARQIYTGRVEPQSLATAFRTTLEANGWRHVSSTTAPGQGTTQVYEKGGNSLQVVIYERFWWTVAEVTTTRVLSAPGSLPR